MIIDLTKCRTKEEIDRALAPLGETLKNVRESFARTFGEPPAPASPPPAGDERKERAP